MDINVPVIEFGVLRVNSNRIIRLKSLFQKLYANYSLKFVKNY